MNTHLDTAMSEIGILLFKTLKESFRCLDHVKLVRINFICIWYFMGS